jgi:predicted ATPase/class 3 adenylate cyclase
LERRNLPTGTVTFFFSDIEDSTGVLQRIGPAFRSTLERHAEIVRACLDGHDGLEVSTEGDSFFAVFEKAPSAVAAATEVQRRIDEEDWPEGGAIRLRIGLHAGSAEVGHDDYVGIDVHRASRIGGAGHGGQILVSDAVRALASGSDYVDLGRHRLKGLEEPVHLFQLKVPGLEQAFPPLRSSDARPNNLPSLETRIIGREADVSEVVRLLEDNRLVTIVGPGGIGKTRLAIEVGGEVLSEFQDGVYLVELAPVADPDLVIPKIAAVLGVDDVSVEALADVLEERTLLLLDNLEQVPGAGPDIRRLLDQASHVKVLVTSQAPLRLGGERTYRLSPLPWEGVDSPAVEVFASRAAEIDPSFELEPHRDAVAQLAEALDGVPLALELAASRANVLTPEEIVSRITAGVDLLKASGGDTPERHRSMTAAIEWSFDMLTGQQQRLLECFAVFRGGATLASLEALAGFDPLDDLGELLDRSLVNAVGGRAGKRFEVLAPVRLYTASRLEDAGALANRHAEFFHRLALDAEEPLETDSRARWAAALGDDHENLQAALEHLQRAGDVTRGLNMLGSTWRYYQVVGRFRELELWLTRFFDLPAAGETSLARARGLMARAAVHYWRTDPRAIDDYQEAVDIAREMGDDAVMAYALAGLGASISATKDDRDGSIERVGPILDEAWEIFEMLGDKGGLAVVEAARAFTSSWDKGQLTPHRADLERLAELYEAAGQRINTAHTILGIAAGEVMEGHPEEALKQALTSLSIAEESGDRFVMIWALEWIATAKADLGDPLTAALLAGAAGAGREKAGGGWTPATYGLDDAVTRVKKALGDAADELLTQGEAMSLHEAVELAKG